MVEPGISLYLASGRQFNLEIIRKAEAAGITKGFTSLHIPEEEGEDYRKQAIALLEDCAEAKIRLTVDVSPETPGKLGISAIEELRDLGVEAIRLDFGFEEEDIVNLSRIFHIVWNASTVPADNMRKWISMGADTTHFTACHNYYPKCYTGLSLEKVRKINEKLKLQGYRTEAFIPGNKVLRGPLKEGLPTVEAHRNQKDLLLAMLELADASTDVVYIGDADVTAPVWKWMKDVKSGFVPLHAELYSHPELYSVLQHDRPDSSEYVIRSQESRQLAGSDQIPAENVVERNAGDICMSNEDFLRYRGEVEVCRKALPRDPRVNVIGKIAETDLAYLPYIKDGMGFCFLQEP